VDQVPDVSGMLGAEAAETIEQVDMTVRFVATSDGKAVDDDDARTSLVVETYPKAGTDVRSDREVTVYVGTDTTVTAAPTLDAALDLTTDEGLCAADAELTNLELNDALAPQLGFPADRDARTVEQDDAIKAYKNAAFARACPERAS
jgi:lactate dehydrogenase-like 2-hydroxyacid dehydrogenase